MIADFSKLTQEEQELLYKVPVLATILIAGADNDIDLIEKKVAGELTRFKAHTAEPELRQYYARVSVDFKETMETLVAQYPEDAADRNPVIINELKQVKPILKKLNVIFSHEFEKSIKEIARYVAEASGGVIGYMSVSREEEQALLNLDMVFK